MDSVENYSLNVNNISPSCTDAEHQFLEDSLQGLQRFWNQEILHLQQHEPRHQFCSSLEKQLLYDDYLTKVAFEGIAERKQRKVFRQRKSEQSRVVRGEDVNDIPTTYLISGLQTHEIPVIGTYVDRSILPGFRYKVRLNQTKKYLFGGHALRLLSVGPGYAKRLTFEGNSCLKNPNYFWSDNHPEGYGFALEVIFEGDTFLAQHPNHGEIKGVVEIFRILKPQRELETELTEDGVIVKTVEISVLCRYVDKPLLAEFRLDGVATILRPKGSSTVASVKSVLSHHSSQTMELLPIKF